MLNFAKPVEFSAEPDTRTSVLASPLGVHSIIKRSKTRENGSRAVSISNKRTSECYSKDNRKCAFIPGAVYTSTPADVPDPPFRFFEGLVPRLSPPRAVYGERKRSGLRHYFRPRADCPGGHPALGQNVLGGQPIYYSWPSPLVLG